MMTSWRLLLSSDRCAASERVRLHPRGRPAGVQTPAALGHEPFGSKRLGYNYSRISHTHTHTHTHTRAHTLTHTHTHTHTHTLQTHTSSIIQSIIQWNVFSAFNPSKLEQWAADCAAPGEQFGVSCLAQGSHLSRGCFRIRSHNLGLPRVSSPTLYSLGHDCPHDTHTYSRLTLGV